MLAWQAAAQVPPGTPIPRPVLDWRPYFPWDRLQARGQRWSNPWMNQSTPWQWLFGQFTLRYPDANDGTEGNRPDASFPVSFGLPGFYASHRVEYFNNVHAAARQDPIANEPYDYNDLRNYQEVQSMASGGGYVETWGQGNFFQFSTFLDNEKSSLRAAAVRASRSR